MRPGAGAEIICLINIYWSQFGGCQDEEQPVSTSFGMALLVQISFKWQYMAGASAGAGVEIRAKVETESEPKKN